VAASHRPRRPRPPPCLHPCLAADIGANLLDGMYQGVYNEKTYHAPDLDEVLQRAWDAGASMLIAGAHCVSTPAHCAPPLPCCRARPADHHSREPCRGQGSAGPGTDAWWGSTSLRLAQPLCCLLAPPALGTRRAKERLLVARLPPQSGCSARWVCTPPAAASLRRTLAGPMRTLLSWRLCCGTASPMARWWRWERRGWTTTGRGLTTAAVILLPAPLA
jgi:hypothetical protein